ncbi:MAG: lysophospholipid acyltransferase family protein [Anaerolineales bacterium]
MSEETRAQCAGLTKTGVQCKNLALVGEAYCRLHLPEPSGETKTEQEARLRVELQVELDELVERLREIQPDYEPPPLSTSGLIDLIKKYMPDIPFQIHTGITERLSDLIREDLLDIETWKGLWFMINYSIQYQTDFVKRRFTGEYETDEWGLDWEFVEVVRPFLEFMYYRYWRVETNGFENIPNTGRALLVSNHSGQLPWDGAMITTAIYSEHPYQRLTRNLYATWFPTLPFISTLLERGGQVMASVENGTRLLEQGELVAVFPEGIKGVSKLFKDRYRLARFGRGGFVKMALSTQAPMIPISVVGAEETYISVYKSSSIAKLIGFPFFPISLRFPWLGLLGIVPFPTKWYIDIGDPISTEEYSSDDAKNLVLVSQLSDQVRNVVQQMINNRLAQRKSVFRG